MSATHATHTTRGSIFPLWKKDPCAPCDQQHVFWRSLSFFFSFLLFSFILHLHTTRTQSHTVLIFLSSLFPVCSLLLYHRSFLFPFQASITRTEDYVFFIHGSHLTPFSASSKTLPLQTFLPLPHTRTLSLSKTQKTCYGFWCLHSPATLLTFFQAGYRQIPPREPYPSFFLSESSRASTSTLI